MTQFLLLLGTIVAQANGAPALECKAIYRTLDEYRRGVEKEQPLLATEFGAATRYETELEGKFFSVVAERGGSLLAQITVAPDYTKGSVSRAQLDPSGRYSLSTVDGVTVHRLECRKN